MNYKNFIFVLILQIITSLSKILTKSLMYKVTMINLCTSNFLTQSKINILNFLKIETNSCTDSSNLSQKSKHHFKLSGKKSCSYIL